MGEGAEEGSLPPSLAGVTAASTAKASSTARAKPEEGQPLLPFPRAAKSALPSLPEGPEAGSQDWAELKFSIHLLPPASTLHFSAPHPPVQTCGERSDLCLPGGGMN